MAIAPTAPALELQVGAGLQWQALREQGVAGQTLVREQGLSPQFRAAAVQPLADAWVARAALAGSAGRARYDGRTQGGAPIGSGTDMQSATFETALQWRPAAASGAGLEAGLQVERFRRRLNGVDTYGGLDERLTQPRWLLGASWRGDAWSLRAAALWGDRAPLEVRFDDGLYDRAHLRSGRAAGWAIDAARALGRGWRVVVGAESLAVGRSLEATLARGGVVAGTVAQPRWRRERILLMLERVLGD
jgi:hypothetical protein